MTTKAAPISFQLTSEPAPSPRSSTSCSPPKPPASKLNRIGQSILSGVSSLGDSGGKGFITGVQGFFSSTENAQLVHHFAHEILLGQSSEKTLRLHTLLLLAFDSSDQFTVEHCKELVDLLNGLLEDEDSLKTLGLNKEEQGELKELKNFFSMLPAFLDSEKDDTPSKSEENDLSFSFDENYFSLDSTASDLPFNSGKGNRAFYAGLTTEDVQDHLKKSVAIVAKLIERKRGAVINAVSYLHEALLHPKNGFIKKLGENLGTEFTDKRTGLIAKVIRQFKCELNKDDGICALLNKKLTTDERSILNNAVTFLHDKIIAPQGLLDQLTIKLTQGEASLLQSSLTILSARLIGPQGILTQFKTELHEKVTAEADPRLIKVRKLIKEFNCLYCKTPNSTKIKVLAAALYQLTNELIKDKDQIFVLSPLDSQSCNRLGKLSRLWERILNSDDSLTPHLTPEHLNELEDFINRLCKNEEGTIQQAARIFYETVADPALTRAERLPGVWIDQCEQYFSKRLGIAPKPKTTDSLHTRASRERFNASRHRQTLEDNPTSRIPWASSDSTFSSEPSDLEGPEASSTGADDLETSSSGPLTSLGGMLFSMVSFGISNATNSIAQKSFYGLTLALTTMISEIYDKIKERDDCPQQKQSLLELQQQLESLKDNPDDLIDKLKALYATLSEHSEVFNSIKIYVNGFKIPGIHLPKSGKSKKSRPNPEAVFSKNIQALRAKKSSKFSPVKEKHKNWQDLYGDIDKFILNTTDLSTAKYIYETICGQTFDTDSYLPLANQAKKPDGMNLKALILADLRSKGVHSFNYYLASFLFPIVHFLINGFIQRASNTFFEEIVLYIQKEKPSQFQRFKEARLNDTTGYLCILNDAFKYIARNPCVSGTMNNMLKQEMERPERNNNQKAEAIYAQFARNVINKGAGNFLTAWVLRRLIGNPEDMVKNILDTSINSLRDINGYTHALNTIICDLLTEVLEKMDSGDSTSMSDDPAVHFTPKRKEQLSALVKNLLSVLGKANASTVDELLDIIDDKDLKNKLLRIVDTFFIKDVIEQAAIILSGSIDKFAQEDELQNVIHKFLKTLNGFYDITERTTREEAHTKEREMRELAATILRNAVSQAVDRRLNSDQRAQIEANAVLATRRDKTKEFIASIYQSLTELLTMDFSTLDARMKAKTLLEQVDAFQTENSAQLSKIRETFKDDNVDELLERFVNIGKSSEPLNQKIKSIDTKINNFEKHKRFSEILKLLILNLSSLPVYSLMTESSISEFEQQIQRFKQHIDALIAIDLDESSDMINPLKGVYQQMLQIDSDLRREQRAQSFAQQLLARDASSPIKQIQSAKSSIFTFRRVTREFQRQINEMVPPGKRPLFLTALENLIRTKAHGQEEQVQIKGFLNLARQLADESNRSLIESVKRQQQMVNELRKKVLESDLVQFQEQVKKNDIQNDVNDSITLLRQFEAEHPQMLTDIVYVNFTPVDPSMFTGFIENQVYNRVWDRVDGLMQLWGQNHLYYSLFTRLGLMPYNKHTEEHEPSLLHQAIRLFAPSTAPMQAS